MERRLNRIDGSEVITRGKGLLSLSLPNQRFRAIGVILMLSLAFLFSQIAFASELNLVSDDFQGEEGLNSSWETLIIGNGSIIKKPYSDEWGATDLRDTVLQLKAEKIEYPDSSIAGIRKEIPEIIREQFNNVGTYIGYELQDDYSITIDPTIPAPYFDWKIIFENNDSIFIRMTSLLRPLTANLTFKLFRNNELIYDTLVIIQEFIPNADRPKIPFELIRCAENQYNLNDVITFEEISVPKEIQFYVVMKGGYSNPGIDDYFSVSIDDIYCYPDYNNFMVAEYPNEIGVLKDENINVNFKNMFTLEPINEVSVKLTDNKIGGYLAEGVTDVNGDFGSIAYLEANYPIELLGEKIGYITYTGNITPYLWSNVPEAFGMNNQEHIVRKPNTDEMSMVYTTGDSIIYAKSSDFGATWELEVLGEGDKPTMIQTADGYLSAWVENNCDLVYTLSQSPWIPIDTLNPDLYWVTEPTLGYTAVNDKSYLGYIGNNQLIGESGNYVLASMTNLDPATLTFDTVVSYLGDVNKPSIVPMKSPVFSIYNISTDVSKIIGFIDLSDEYIYKLWNIKKGLWDDSKPINLTGQFCNAPTTDYYGEATTFAYEVINLDGTRDIWEAKMTDGVMEAPTKTNSFVGVNKNPKVKNNYLTAYVNNDDKVISEPGYGLTYQQNVVASTEDSIFSYDVNLKETYTSKKGLFVWTEGSNGIYKLNMKQVSYKPEPVPYIASEPTDTITTVTVSPLYEYIAVKEPVEQLNTTINGLNPEMNYTIKVITSEGSPVKPQIIQIDGEVYAVVTGHANRSDTTEITLPKETYQDYSVVVSIDRKRGNPNRDAEVLVYQYETDGEEVVAVSNKIKMLTPVNTDIETTTKSLFTTKEEAYINYTTAESKEIEVIVYDITGSKITSSKKQVKAGVNKLMLNGINKSGVYFAVIKNGEEIETSRINIIK